MDIRRLEAFAKVYELKSFSKAAQDLFLSQPTISAHISVLEEELGARLFDRIGKTILPTRTGDALYVHAKTILHQLSRAQAEIRLLQDKVSGEIVIGASTIPADYVLPKLLAIFKRQNPEVTLRLEVGDSSQILEEILAGQLDVGFVGALDPHKDLEYLPLMRDELVLIAGQESGFKPGQVIGREILQRIPWVMREFGSGTRRTIEQGISDMGLDPRELNVTATVHGTNAVLRCVQAGLGISVTSWLAAQDFLDRGDMIQLGMPDFKARRCFYAVHHRLRQQLPATRAFLTLVRRERDMLPKDRQCPSSIS